MSDAVGAGNPDDRAAFNAIVGGIDWSDVELDTNTDAPQSTEPPAQPAHTARTAPEVTPEPPEPPLPDLPKEPEFEADKEYRFHKGLDKVYWIAIATGAVGQVVFFGSLFGLGAWGYAAAVVIATTAETVMVTSGDTALRHRVLGAKRRRWFPFLLGSFAAAAAASAMNLSHFWHINPSLAVLFGGVSLIGYLLHIWDGFVKGSDYLDAKGEYDAAVQEREATVRQRAEARYERWLADRETQRQASDRAVAVVEPEPQPEPAKQKSPTRAARKNTTGKPQLDRGTAVQWANTNNVTTPAPVEKHFSGQGYRVPTRRTISNWLNATDQ